MNYFNKLKNLMSGTFYLFLVLFFLSGQNASFSEEEIDGYKYDLEKIEKQAIKGIKKTDKAIEKEQKKLIKVEGELEVLKNELKNAKDSISAKVFQAQVPFKETIVVLEDKLTKIELSLKQKELSIEKLSKEKDSALRRLEVEKEKIDKQLRKTKNENISMSKELEDLRERLNEANALNKEKLLNQKRNLMDKLNEEKIKNSFLLEEINDAKDDLEKIEKQAIKRIKKTDKAIEKEQKKLIKVEGELEVLKNKLKQAKDSISAKVFQAQVPFKKTIMVLEDKLTKIELSLKQKELSIEKLSKEKDSTLRRLEVEKEKIDKQLRKTKNENISMSKKFEDLRERLNEANALNEEKLLKQKRNLMNKLKEEKIKNSFLLEEINYAKDDLGQLKLSIPGKIFEESREMVKELKAQEYALERKMESLNEELNVTKSLLPLKFNYGKVPRDNKISIFEYRIKEIQQYILELKKNTKPINP